MSQFMSKYGLILYFVSLQKTSIQIPLHEKWNTVKSVLWILSCLVHILGSVAKLWRLIFKQCLIYTNCMRIKTKETAVF